MFPANAGMIPYSSDRYIELPGVPRECGDDPAANAAAAMDD